MQMTFLLKSYNRKTGKIPVSGSPGSTCPDSCPLKAHGCYAKYGPISWKWAELNDGRNKGISWKAFLQEIRNLPDGTFWRHNQYGDLAHRDGKINLVMLIELVAANKGRCGYTYSHHEVLTGPNAAWNRLAIRYANNNGFTINLSANNLVEAVQLQKLGIAPVVSIIPKDSPNVIRTKEMTMVVCPALSREDMTCEKCQLCSRQHHQRAIVGFKSHGIGAKYGEALANASMVIDHILPKSKGGKNSPENIRLVDRTVNEQKKFFRDKINPPGNNGFDGIGFVDQTGI